MNHSIANRRQHQLQRQLQRLLHTNRKIRLAAGAPGATKTAARTIPTGEVVRSATQTGPRDAAAMEIASLSCLSEHVERELQDLPIAPDTHETADPRASASGLHAQH